jgi:hypothetical protein
MFFPWRLAGLGWWFALTLRLCWMLVGAVMVRVVEPAKRLGFFGK